MGYIELGFMTMQVVLVRLALRVGKKDEGFVACSMALFILIGLFELALPLNLL